MSEKMIVKQGEAPINYAILDKVQKMDDVTLASYLQEICRERKRRKLARAEKLITKACDALNELQAMGVMFIVQDTDGYDFHVFDGERTFDTSNFVLLEEKV